MRQTTAKEAYAMFLASDFWKALSFTRRQQAGFKCERCSKLDHCQSHHRVYREHWFDTKLEDLECICRECHEKEHGIRTDKTPAPGWVQPAATGIEGWTWKTLLKARTEQRITRQEFKKLSPLLKPSPKQRRKGPRKRRNGRLLKLKIFKNSVRRFSTHRPHWISRGQSSN